MNQNSSSSQLGPKLTLSLPVLILFLFIFILAGAGFMYMLLQQAGSVVEPTPVPSGTPSLPPTMTPTPETPTPTITPLPSLTPFTHIVQSGDLCSTIAYLYGVSSQSIIELNGLTQDCYLSVNQILLIPQPTTTPTPQASDTPSVEQMTREACQSEVHTVQEGETLSIIAFYKGIPSDAIKKWNNLTSDQVYTGQKLFIPLCEKTIDNGATVTPSPAPPYPRTELMLPVDGDHFDKQDIAIVQWASVGELRANEAYQVTLVDVTDGQFQYYTDEVRDTKFNVPSSLQPEGNQPHIFEWWVIPVAQIGVDASGLPIWSPGGPESEHWYFTWEGSGN